MTTYVYGQQHQVPARLYTIDTNNQKVAPAAATDDTVQNATFLGPLAAASAVAGFLAFLVNPLFGMFAMAYGVRGVMVMAQGRLADAHYAARTSMWFTIISIITGLAAFIVITILLREKFEWFDDNLQYTAYVPRVCLPLFPWDLTLPYGLLN